MNIAVIGAGYVGLVTAACLSNYEHVVLCIDKDEAKIESLKNNIMPIYESGLGEKIYSNVNRAHLFFDTDITLVKECDVIFIAVGTPARACDGHADLSYVYSVARKLASVIKPGTTIVIKSTVPVGTGDEVERIIRERTTIDFDVVSNPEFLREGVAIDDFQYPDRIVIGSSSSIARQTMAEVYRSIDSQIVYTDRRTSELIKYASNAFLATKLSFINEMSDLCEKVEANVEDLSLGIGLDSRIGSKFLSAGPGYGGSCFPKDTLALLKTAEDNNTSLRIVQAAVDTNNLRKRAMGRKILKVLGDNPRGKRVSILGLTFKPETDDMRDSPSIDIIQVLLDAGVKVSAYDPEGMKEASKLMPNVLMCRDSYLAAIDADAVVFVTDWDELMDLDLTELKSVMKGSEFIDLRNMFDPEDVKQANFNYHGIGL